MPCAIHLASAIADRCLQQVSGVTEALTGSLDLAVSYPGPRNPHLLAAHDAASSLALQLRLLRSVWTEAGQSVPVKRLPDLLRGAPGWEFTRLDISELPARTVLPPPRGRVVIAAILLALEALPQGGTVRLRRGEPGAIDVALSGADGRWPAQLATMLQNKEMAWYAVDGFASGLPAFLVLLAHALGVPLALIRADPGQPERLRVGGRRLS